MAVPSLLFPKDLFLASKYSSRVFWLIDFDEDEDLAISGFTSWIDFYDWGLVVEICFVIFEANLLKSSLEALRYLLLLRLAINKSG